MLVIVDRLKIHVGRGYCNDKERTFAFARLAISKNVRLPYASVTVRETILIVNPLSAFGERGKDNEQMLFGLREL